MIRELTIDGITINDENACYVIAEIGHNHQGDLEQARQLFRSAKDCGVQAVKLQKRENRSLYTHKMYDMPYDNENSFGPTYGTHREALEFGREEFVELKRHARELGLTLFATVFDFPSTDFMADLETPAFKIASGDLTNTPLIEYVARIGKPMIISTGGGSMEDVQRAYDTVMPINSHVAFLQCTSGYPCRFDEMNLRVITTYRERFPDTVIGLSGHDNSIAMALVAYMLGARIIEKHFTLNRAMKGTDHAFSLERPGMQRMVRDLIRAREALGDGNKHPYPSEAPPLRKMGKKLVAAHDLPAGHILTREDIAIKSPNDGLPPCKLDHVIGKTIRYALQEDENILFEGLIDPTE